MSEQQSESFRNQFLIALPALESDYFHHTVSLLIDHNAQGAFGVVINRPVEITLSELFPDFSPGEAADAQCPVLEGGPVQQDRVFFLHESSHEYQSTFRISDDIYLTTSTDLLKDLSYGTGPARVMALLGYAGWGEGQLETELGENVWLLSPASARIVFDVPYKDRPAEAAQLLGVDLNLISTSAGHG